MALSFVHGVGEDEIAMEGFKGLQTTVLRSDRTNENLSFLVGKQWWKIYGVCLFEKLSLVVGRLAAGSEATFFVS